MSNIEKLAEFIGTLKNPDKAVRAFIALAELGIIKAGTEEKKENEKTDK